MNTTTLAQLIQREDQNKNRYRQALDLLIEAEQEADKMMADVKDAIAQHTKEGEKLKEETAQLRAARRKASGDDQQAEGDKGKGKGRANGDTPEVDLQDLEADEEGIPRNPAGDAHRAKSTSLSQRLRENRIVLHKIKFLQGDVYHVLGKSYENAENEAYAAAQELRSLLLKGILATYCHQAIPDASSQGRRTLRRRL